MAEVVQPPADSPRTTLAARIHVLRRWLTVPSLVYAASLLLTALVAVLSRAQIWQAKYPWDTEHYLEITQRGYFMVPSPDCFANLCSDSAWFPGYSYAIRAVTWLGISPTSAGRIVTEVCFFLLLVVIWHLMDHLATPASVTAMVLGGIFAGGIYFHSVFPMSMCALGLALAVLGVKRENWWFAGLGGFLALFAHTAGVIAAVMLVLTPLFAWRSASVPGRVLRGLGSASIALAAYAIVAWRQSVGTGHWNAYWIHQHDVYNQGSFKNPFSEWLTFRNFPFSHWYGANATDSWLVRHSMWAHTWQWWINIVLLLAFLGVAAWLAYRKRIESWEIAALLLVCGAYAMPFFTGGTMSWYRVHAMMIVGLPLLRHLPSRVNLGLVLICLVQYAFLGAMWFNGTLI